MERDLLQREIVALEIAPKFKHWIHPGSAFYASQTGDLHRLFEESLIFGEYYRSALQNKFSLKGRFSMVDTGTFQRLGGTSDALGFTDKKKGQAFLVEFFKRGVSSIEGAIHEGLHLISFPLKGATDQDLAFAKRYGYPLMEAVTQYFTRIMMIEAGLKNWKTNVYQAKINKYLKPFFKAFNLLQFSIENRLKVLCELVFKNNLKFFIGCLELQLGAVNNSVPKNELPNWTNKLDLIFARRMFDEAVKFIEFFIQKDYKQAEAIFAKALAAKS
ncbi:MAG TPA: hypothetical protein VGC97_03525 [Pyrinomonadaceae bacterium]|jgi:hypothetical protein